MRGILCNRSFAWRMRALASLACFAQPCFASTAYADDAPPDWENPAVFARNTEPPHATFYAYPDDAAALANRVADNPWYKSLNGKWKFWWTRTADKRPFDFYKPEFDVTGWAEIDVP